MYDSEEDDEADAQCDHDVYDYFPAFGLLEAEEHDSDAYFYEACGPGPEGEGEGADFCGIYPGVDVAEVRVVATPGPEIGCEPEAECYGHESLGYVSCDSSSIEDDREEIRGTYKCDRNYIVVESEPPYRKCARVYSS